MIFLIVTLSGETGRRFHVTCEILLDVSIEK